MGTGRTSPLLLLAATLVGCAAPPTPPTVYTVPPADRAYPVVRVIDGDTLVIGVPMARGGLLARPVRLLGIDTPERGEVGFEAATAALAAIVEGRAVQLAYGRRSVDAYGRILAVVLIDGADVVERLTTPTAGDPTE